MEKNPDKKDDKKGDQKGSDEENKKKGKTSKYDYDGEDITEGKKQWVTLTNIIFICNPTQMKMPLFPNVSHHHQQLWFHILYFTHLKTGNLNLYVLEKNMLSECPFCHAMIKPVLDLQFTEEPDNPDDKPFCPCVKRKAVIVDGHDLATHRRHFIHYCPKCHGVISDETATGD